MSAPNSPLMFRQDPLDIGGHQHLQSQEIKLQVTKFFLSRAQHSHVETQKHPSRLKRPCCFDREEGRKSIATMKLSATLHVFRMTKPQRNPESWKLCGGGTLCPFATMNLVKPSRLLRACLVTRIHSHPPGIPRMFFRSKECRWWISRFFSLKVAFFLHVLTVSCSCLPWRLQYCKTSRTSRG